MSTLRSVLAVSMLLAAANAASAQVLVGYDGAGLELTEFTQTSGGLCAAPNPESFVCSAGVPPACPELSILFSITDPLHGDVTIDPSTDTTYITDGRVVRAYVGDLPCGAAPPCTHTTGFVPNAVVPALGPITGLGCDGFDPSAGGAVIYVTDGFQVVGLVPPAVCGDLPTLLYGPCPVPAVMQPVTDVSYDAFDRVLWMISDIGNISFINPMACTVGPPPVSVAACGIAGPFTGLAYDISTPNPNPQNNSAWVCNAAGEIAYVETYTGIPGASTFAGPVPCTTQPEPLSGLAVAYRGVNYGASRDVATLQTFGQSTSPSTTFGIDVIDAPATGTSFLIINYSWPGPGFFCPSLPGVGTDIWVDPTAPGAVIGLPPLGPGCTSIPLPLPSGILLGTNIYMQLVFMDGGPPALDATPGLAVTIGFY